MKRQDVADGAIERGRYPDRFAELDHAAAEPIYLEAVAAFEIVVHRGRHLGRKAVAEFHALLGKVLAQADAVRTPDREHFADEIEKECPGARILADRPDGQANARSRARHGDQEHELFPDRALDVGAELGVDAAAGTCFEQRRGARGPAAVVFAEYEPLHLADVAGHAPTRGPGADVAHAPHPPRLPPNPPPGLGFFG